jgi:hypothetical protein
MRDHFLGHIVDEFEEQFVLSGDFQFELIQIDLLQRFEVGSRDIHASQINIFGPGYPSE